MHQTARICTCIFENVPAVTGDTPGPCVADPYNRLTSTIPLFQSLAAAGARGSD